MMPVDKLTATKIKNAKPGKYGDGKGLWLYVGPKSKSWVFRYSIPGDLSRNGKPRSREIGIGSAAIVTIAEAREKARRFRTMVSRKPEDGPVIDPLHERQAAEIANKIEVQKTMTFRACAEAYMRGKSPEWKNDTHAKQWPSSLAQYVYPVLGNVPVHLIDTALVMKVLEPHWHTHPETMSRVRGRIERILGWATTSGFRTGDNPAAWRGHLENLLAAKRKVKESKNFAALKHEGAPDFMMALRQRDDVASVALEFTILTACRSEEVLAATWDEINLDAMVFTVPKGRMKAGVEHIVPLSDAALSVLRRMEEIRQNDFLFPGRNGRLAENALFYVLRKMNRSDITVHGFRACFRTWAGEKGVPRELAEHALAHKLGDATEQSYNRTTAVARRARVMQQWARFLAQPVMKGEVVRLGSPDDTPGPHSCDAQAQPPKRREPGGLP
jgi:integrase